MTSEGLRMTSEGLRMTSKGAQDNMAVLRTVLRLGSGSGRTEVGSGCAAGSGARAGAEKPIGASPFQVATMFTRAA